MSITSVVATAVPARPAATVVLLRDTAVGLEVHLHQRRAEMDVGALAYVFPGGSVDAQDRAPETLALVTADLETPARRMELGNDLRARRLCAALHLCAIRECFEEAGVLLAHPMQDLDFDLVAAARDRVLALNDMAIELRALGLTPRVADLVYVARFITPVGLPRRYDTYFFAIRMPDGQVIDVHRGEARRGGWYRPADLLASADRGEVILLPPTRVMLAELARHPDVDTALDDLGTREVCGILFSLDHAAAVLSLPDHLPSVGEIEAGRLRA